jgi:hypothetical protein
VGRPAGCRDLPQERPDGRAVAISLLARDGSGLPDLDEPVIKGPVDACTAIISAHSARKPVCPDAAANAVRAARSAAFAAALQGFSEASGYCAALAVEALILERLSPKAAGAKAVDAIETAEWAVKHGDEPGLYSKLAEKVIELIEDAEGSAPLTILPVSTQPLPPKPDFDRLEAARRALLDYLYSVTAVDGEVDSDRLRNAIAAAGDRLAEVSLLLRKAGKRDPEPVSADDHHSGRNALRSPRPGRQTRIRPRAADDFPAIRARLVELRRREASEPSPVDRTLQGY